MNNSLLIIAVTGWTGAVTCAFMLILVSRGLEDAERRIEKLREQLASKRANWPNDFPPHGRGLRNIKS